MPTVSREIAERLIEKCKTQKKPKIYCIVRYQNRIFDKDDWAVCYRPYHYDGLLQSPAVGGIDVLWGSERFRKDRINEMDEDNLEDFLADCEFSLKEALKKALKTKSEGSKCSARRKAKK